MSNQASERLGDYDENIDQIVARSVELDKSKHPDIEGLKTCVLKQGKIAYKLATYWTIRDRHTGEIHHHALKLETLRRTKQSGWERKAEQSITLDDDSNDEIQRLFDFIITESHVQGDASYTIIRQSSDRLSKVMEAISATTQRQELIEQILKWVDSEPSTIDGLIEFSAEQPERSRSLIAALNYGHYSRVLKEFSNLIDANRPEQAYQNFLEDNYWIFGSEFSERINSRELIANTQFDFPLRRTVDGHLEIIEIKRPITETLFVSPRGAPRAELSEAVAQAENYLDLLDRESDRIWARYKIRADKVRAKLVIGRDHDDDQRDSLRRFNANHNKVEVFTFDQMLKVGQRILDILASENQHISKATSADEIPF